MAKKLTPSEGIDILKKMGLLDAIFGWLGGLFKKKPTPPPGPVTVPTPAPNSPDDFPDDHIPRKPNVGRVVTKVHIGIARAQYSRERFPEEYTPANPFGLIPDAYLRGLEKGQGALPWASKIWLDLTATDQDGHEFLRPDVQALGLAFQTEHHFGDAYIIGKGANPDGTPIGGYDTNDTNEIGNGISAWLSSLGFLHQMQAWDAADGDTFEVYGVVKGVVSNKFKIKVS